MVKYFLRLCQGTNNEIIDDAAICTISINSRWVQTITRLLKTNGYAYVLHNPKNVDRNKLSEKFLQQCKDNYLQNLYYSGSDRIDSYLSLKEDTDKYQFQTYLDKIRIVEHRTTLTRLRTGCTYLTTDTGRFNDTPKHERICPLCNDGVEGTNHFLFQCRKKTNNRVKFENIWNYIKNNKSKIKHWSKEKLKLILNMNFNSQLGASVTKAIFDLYKERVKWEKSNK